MNIADIIKLKFPEVDLAFQVNIQDDGQGPYIKKWDDSLGPKPDQAMLDAWEIEALPIKEAASIRQARRDEYMPIGDQLDALWHAMDDGTLPKIEPIYSTHKAVKEKHKKSGE
jgi:hypothetical protein